MNIKSSVQITKYEKFKWILNTSLKDSVNIEITDQIKSPPDTDKS